MQLYLRDAVGDDLPHLVGLIVGGKLRRDDDGIDHLHDYYEALREIDRTPGNYVLVAERGGRPIAMLQLVTFRHLEHRGGRCAEIESMLVAEDWRGKGIGGQLLEHAIARAKDLGCYRIQLTSNVERPDAHRFYDRHGFTATHRGFKRQLDLDWTPTRSATRRWSPDAVEAT